MPPKLKKCKFIISIQNTHDKCFWYYIFFPFIVNHSNDPIRYINIEENVDNDHGLKFNFNCVNFPSKIHDVDYFKSLNSPVFINIFGYEKGIYPTKIVDHEKEYYTDNRTDTNHFVYIKDLNSVIR